MNSELRKLLISRRHELGVAIEQVAESAQCTVAELRGYEQGLVNLGLERLCGLIRALEVSKEELIATIGEESAADFENQCKGKCNLY